MKAFIAEIVLPDSWTMTDVVCAINIGVQKHYATQISSSPAYVGDHVLYKKLEDPKGLSSCVRVLSCIPRKTE